jgi:DMSO/TMAO reductase YedYZ molybdopterin-dependent catalytic subunit
MEKKQVVNRRKAIITGLASVGGLLLSGCFKKPLPPTYGNILRMGDVFTYFAQRTLLPGQSLVREYQRSDISSFPATGTVNPADPKGGPYYSKIYQDLQRDDFKDWVLTVEGSVAKPGKYSLADLKKLPQRTQITRHTCEEGWSAIAEWSGTPVGLILQNAGILPNARFVSFYCYDNYAESIDMLDALHPQTILAYSMNGGSLPVQHGAPVRLRVETQIGYKSAKYVHRIVVTDKFIDPNGDGAAGWSWYTGI